MRACAYVFAHVCAMCTGANVCAEAHIHLRAQMLVCNCAHMRECVVACVRVCVYAPLCKCMCECMREFANVFVYTHVCAYVRTSSCAFAHARMHSYVYVCTQMCLHACTHMCMCTQLYVFLLHRVWTVSEQKVYLRPEEESHSSVTGVWQVGRKGPTNISSHGPAQLVTYGMRICLLPCGGEVHQLSEEWGICIITDTSQTGRNILFMLVYCQTDILQGMPVSSM